MSARGGSGIGGGVNAIYSSLAAIYSGATLSSGKTLDLDRRLHLPVVRLPPPSLADILYCMKSFERSFTTWLVG
jgi:hypothetical protein